MTTNNKEFNSLVCSLLASALNKACSLSGDNAWKVSVTADAVPSDENPPVRDHISVSGDLSGMFEYEVGQADLDRLATAIASKDPRDLANCLRDELLSSLSKKYKNIKAEVKVAEKLDSATSKSITLAAVRSGQTPLTFTIAMTSPLYDALANPAQPAAPSVPQGEHSNKLNLVLDVELNVMLRFGQRQMALSDILDLKMGSVVELDRKVEEPVELLLDGTVVARGEAVIIDGNYGLRITEVLQPMASQFVN